MAVLRALGSSIEDSGFEDAWVEAGIYGSTTKQQIHAEKTVVIIDGMAVRNGRDLASHFLEIIDSRSKEYDEVYVVFYRYNIPKFFKQGIHQVHQGCNKPMVHQISDGAVFEKITLKRQLSSTALHRWPCTLHPISSSLRMTRRRPVW